MQKRLLWLVYPVRCLRYAVGQSLNTERLRAEIKHIFSDAISNSTTRNMNETQANL